MDLSGGAAARIGLIANVRKAGRIDESGLLTPRICRRAGQAAEVSGARSKSATNMTSRLSEQAVELHVPGFHPLVHARSDRAVTLLLRVIRLCDAHRDGTPARLADDRRRSGNRFPRPRHLGPVRASLRLPTASALLFAVACAPAKDDSPFEVAAGLPPTTLGEAGASSDGGEEFGDDPSTDSDVDPLPPQCGDATCDADEDCASCPTDCNACPSQCGDGQCDPTESCGSCEDDCGQCCGNGTCDASAGEDWTVCFGDCEDEAPMVALDEIYSACAGQGRLYDDGASADYLFVRLDTGALVYVIADVPYEIMGTSFVDGEVWRGEEYLGRIECHQPATGACAPVIAHPIYPDTGGEQAPCLTATHYVYDATMEGNSITFTSTEQLDACASECGDGTCESYEVACGELGNLEHQCDTDCTPPPEGCFACA